MMIKVVYETRSEERAFPASLTKMMTAIVAIENLPDLQADVTIPEDIYQAYYGSQCIASWLQPGETVPAIDLLYGTMLPSEQRLPSDWPKFRPGLKVHLWK